MPRLKIGDRVRILPKEPSPFADLSATIREIQSNSLGVTILDRYVVVFEWGEEQTFYDAQLEHISNLSHGQTAS